jgi:hypothetical protein
MAPVANDTHETREIPMRFVLFGLIQIGYKRREKTNVREEIV